MQIVSSESIHFGTDGWRAVIAEDFTYENLRRVADAAGRVFAEKDPGGTVIVGYDTRFEAGSFAVAAAEVLASHGLDVVVSDRYLPTPALCWSVAQDDSAVGGVMLTASHNPAPYLGFKIRMSDGGASPVSFTERVEVALVAEAPSAVGSYETADLVTPYLASLTDMIDADAIASADLKVAIDPLYGAGQSYLADTMRSLGVEVTEIHSERNPSFGGLHPEPIPPHIDELRDFVRENGLDAGFITDGDADRIGAADAHGEFVNPHRIICLVAQHLAEDKGMSGRIVKTLSTSVLVDRLASKLDLEANPTSPEEYLTVMYDLVALAMQTDTTRVATFQTACEEAGLTDRFPSAIGLANSSHNLSHEKKNYANVAKYITFLNQMHANFIKRLDSIQEEDGTLLDNTLCFYGCATSRTHKATNYPIILSGGKNMGFSHGSHLKYGSDVPLSNLFVTIANQLSGPTSEFSDSTADMTEVLG